MKIVSRWTVERVSADGAERVVVGTIDAPNLSRAVWRAACVYGGQDPEVMRRLRIVTPAAEVSQCGF